MPVKTAKRVVQKAAGRVRQASASVRTHWTQQEALRRRELAEQMQDRLFEALGLTPAPVKKSR